MAQGQPGTGSSPSSPKSSGPTSAVASFGRRLRKWFLWTLVLLVLAVALYVVFALRFAYSEGERAGLVQKFSRRGWVCKTWEGEIAMSAQPGMIPERFAFTVRDEAVATAINASMGKPVSLRYEQRLPAPSCFGDTDYIVTAVRTVTP
jgi:hypothetical protein